MRPTVARLFSPTATLNTNGTAMQDLKGKTIRGGLARLFAVGAGFLLRLGSLMVLARLLGPKDFGLVGMVTAFTGFLGVFRDFGLSAAAVQRTTITEEQMSTLFWINILVGLLLMAVAFAMAPAIAAFYRNPQLFWVTAVLAPGFLFNAAGIQHSALGRCHTVGAWLAAPVNALVLAPIRANSTDDVTMAASA